MSETENQKSEIPWTRLFDVCVPVLCHHQQHRFVVARAKAPNPNSKGVWVHLIAYIFRSRTSLSWTWS